ncbi:hypothetical protein [Novosphingopyxis sp.]|uniref:hypothetical protein n=1 Tax=Novosphingopyxis sp. TaxID=2709690 RepID=UPI003B59190A
MLDDKTIISKICAKLLAATQQEWSQKNRPKLLSALGGVLTDEDRVAVQQEYKSLHNFINCEAEESLLVVKVPRKGLAALPKERELEFNFSPESVEEENYDSPPSYNDEVWDAFTRPISSGTVRIIDLSSSRPRVSEEPIGFDIKADQYAVQEADLPCAVLEGIRVRPKAIHQAIANWSKDKFDRSRIEKSGNVRPRVRQKSAGGDGALFGLMNQSELSRIYIPADIVADLLSRR